MSRAANRTAQQRSRSIDHQLDEARERQNREVQLLILGAAGSGKSTFTKQLRIHYGDGYPADERAKLRPFVFDNICEALSTLVQLAKLNDLKFQSTENQKSADDLVHEVRRRKRMQTASSLSGDSEKEETNMKNSTDPTTATNPIHDVNVQMENFSLAAINMKTVMTLWQDSAIQTCFQKETELTKSDYYFLEELERISNPAYVPTLQDVLYIRRPTLGVVEYNFRASGLDYRVIDVAGQKSQRKKWIHFFDEVTAVIFFASLSSYCEFLEEEPSMNSLSDTMHLFHEISHNEFLRKRDFILFLNKKDVLAEKLKTHQFGKVITGFTGEESPEAVMKFLQAEFSKLKPEKMMLYPHVTCATDMNLMKDVMVDVMQIIVDINLRKTNLL